MNFVLEFFNVEFGFSGLGFGFLGLDLVSGSLCVGCFRMFRVSVLGVSVFLFAYFRDLGFMV